MTGASHFIGGWFVAQAGCDELRDRRIVTWMGVLPDFDSVAYPLGTLFGWSFAEGFRWHRAIHHQYTHGFVMILVAAAVGAFLGRRRVRTALLAGFVVMLHLGCDVIASGPEWPIYPFWPFGDTAWTVAWSFRLNSPVNIVIQTTLIIAAGVYAPLALRSPLEIFSKRREADLIRHFISRRKASPVSTDV